MENPEEMPFFMFAQRCLQLRPWAGQDVASFVCRHGNCSVEVRLLPLCVETPKDSQLNPNAKVFDQMPAECLKKQRAKDPKNGIGKSQSKKLTRKVEARGNLDYKRKLASTQAKVKKTQDMLEAKGIFNQHDFNWTPPSASQETLSGLKTHIRHLCRKEAAMLKLLECVPEVSVEKSKAEKFDDGRRGGAEPKVSEADAKREIVAGLRMLQCLSDGEGEPPSEEILEELGATKEQWSRMFRVLQDDEPSADDLKWLEISKEDVLEFKRRLACMNAFGIGCEEKMRKYWNAFRDGCKGRDVSEMG